jgi:type III secretory pathway component EscR
MPSIIYQQNKKSIYKWRDNNQESYRAYVKAYSEKYNNENRENINKKVLGKYHFKKEAERFRNILIELL